MNIYKIYNHFSNSILTHWIPDKVHLRLLYKARMGIFPNLDHSETFNEKLQWLKLHDRNPLYTQLVDKYEVRKYIAEKIGSEYIIPMLGVWDRFEDIDFNTLPEQFVLKCTHDSGGLVICTNKSSLDIEASREKINMCMKKNYYYHGREWPYKNVPRKIIAEKYMTNSGDELQDYKIHNFNGIPKIILVCRDRFKESGLTEDFFTENWEHLDMKRPGHPNSSEEIPRPKELDKMLKISKKLSENIPFLRTDFYTAGGKVYFGELTFYPASGFTPFIPDDSDEKLGTWIELPNIGEEYPNQ